MATLANNKKALHDYLIDETIEAGLVLEGPEVKSIRNGQVSLNGSYVSIRGGQAYLKNAFVAKYKNSPDKDLYNESRERKLLLHKNEISKLANKLDEKGTAIVPLEIYTSKRRIKIRIALAHGKKQYDKRASIKAKETKRQIDRSIRTRI
ncbi:MAG: SsrA-binding protein SmpB [Candidatus Doudnabacteria bacterium]|nr:SsrA-binding protein SmpB [Candidatus Doudnabacteria bacterium]